MKDSENLLKILNQRLTDEHVALIQYFGNSETQNNRTYEILKETFKKQAFDEMHYASWLIQRIIFVEGITAVQKLDAMNITETDFELAMNNRDVEMKELTVQNKVINY